MRVAIEQDMEGCAGVFDWGRVLKQTGRMEWATRVMTDEANAAVEGALAGGADEVLIYESHPFDRARLHPRAHLVTESVYTTQEPADLLFFVGRHAMSGVADGILNHTGSSRSIIEARVNGQAIGELGLVAAGFGSRGTPTALVTGDEAACREARELLGDVETIAVKRGASCLAGESLGPEEACARIRAGAEHASQRGADFSPIVPRTPAILEIDYRHSEVADWVCRATPFARVSARTVRAECAAVDDLLRMWAAQGPALYRFDAY